MELNPIDFFPGYDPYYATRGRTRSYSVFINILTHFLAMVFAIGLCAGAFYYYDSHIKNRFDDLFGTNKKVFNKDESEINMKKILDEMKEIKGEIETNIWRKHLDDLFSKIYLKQEHVIDQKIEKALDLYDADKVGLFDYASVYAFGAIISTPDTVPYPANKSISFFSLFNVDIMSNPEMLLQPNNLPGNCFAFYGNTGRIRIKLGNKIIIKAVTLDHIKFKEDISSAPREFEVYGLQDPTEINGVFLGKFVYDLEGRPYQTFRIDENYTRFPFEHVELSILSNHGRQDFTCVYRFRVHSIYLE